MSGKSDTGDRRGVGVPYLVVLRRDGSRTRTKGPFSAMSPAKAVEQALEGMYRNDVAPSGVDAEVYPLGVTDEGDVERLIIEADEVEQ